MAATVQSTGALRIFELRRHGVLSGAIRPWWWRSIRTGRITRLIFLKASHSEIQIIFGRAGVMAVQRVQLVRTACRYGGSRPWFRCHCGRRVGVLFDAGGGFFCRKCLRLRYECQLETKRWRAISRAQSIRMRLGGSANVLEPFPERPRYMRQKRYERLRAQALASLAIGLGTLERSLDRRLRKATRPSYRTRSTH